MTTPYTDAIIMSGELEGVRGITEFFKRQKAMNIFNLFLKEKPSVCKSCGNPPATDEVYTSLGTRFVTKCPQHAPFVRVKLCETRAESVKEWQDRNV